MTADDEIALALLALLALRQHVRRRIAQGAADAAIDLLKKLKPKTPAR